MTKECIDSIFEKTHGIEFEVILVDNASTDGSKYYFVKESRIKYIYNEENLCFGRANNIGVEVSTGRNILFLNSDTLLRNNAVKILSDYLDDDKTVGACGGNLFNAEGKHVYSYNLKFPSIWLDINLLLHNVPGRLLYRGNLSFNNTNSVLDVSFITGADLMVKHSVLSEVGAFNPEIFMYFEDSELCYRIKRTGYKIHSVPVAEITHLVSASVKNAEKNRMRKKNEIFRDGRIKYHQLTNRSRFYIWVDLLITSEFMKKLFFVNI